MASTILSSTSYLNYLNDYLHRLLNSPDRYLIQHLYETYFDEIETYARVILARWSSEQMIDKQAAVFIENLGYLHRKIGLLTKTYQFNSTQFERIENLLFNPELIRLLTFLIQSLISTNSRHEDKFLPYFSIFIDAYSYMKYSKPIFPQLTAQGIQSKYYKKYLIELISSQIQGKHLFFIGAIGQLAVSHSNSTLHSLYSQFLQTFYHQKYFSKNPDLHYCTLGILSQLDISSLINDYPCLSTLVVIFLNENLKSFLLPILNLFNSLCIQSKTIACYLNTDPFIDQLLQSVTNQSNSLIHLHACLLLGHIISEKQLIKLRISYKLTMKLMDLLENTKQETDHILSSLLSLSIHEEIQMILAETYQLKTLIQLSKYHPIVYEIIWKISFHPNIVEQLITRYDDFLKHLSTMPRAEGILENIRMKNSSRPPTTNEISFDISLISSPKDQIIVQQIEENLQKNHFRIGTISNSTYVLLCISEESKHDCACQAAIRQALFQYKKVILCIVQKPYRIDDWFSKLHISEEKPWNILDFDLDKLLSEIRKDLHHNPQLPTVTKKTRIIAPPETTFITSPPSVLPTVASPIIPRKKIQNWTNREVLEWCVNNKLSGFSKILTLYDGRNLLALAHVSRMSAPHTIINQLRSDCRKQGLSLTFVEYVRFQTALDELLRLERNLAKKQSISTLATRYVYKGKMTNQT